MGENEERNETMDEMASSQPEKVSKSYLLGRNIIMFLIVSEFFLGIYNFLYDRNFLSFTLIGCLLIALFYGATWVRGLFVALYVLIAFNCLYVMNGLFHQPEIKWISVAVFAFQFIYSLGAGALIMYHKGVKEYLFEKRRV